MPSSQSLPMRGLNHVSRVCKDVEATATFYRDLLGFHDIRRPKSFDFEGAWLFSPNCSVGLHLISGTPVERSATINPKSDHLSFLCTSLEEVQELLVKQGVAYVKQEIVEEDGFRVTQVFFHDPENNMIEICNCDEFPVEPLACPSCPPRWNALRAAGSASDDNMSDCMSDLSTRSMEQGAGSPPGQHSGLCAANLEPAICAANLTIC